MKLAKLAVLVVLLAAPLAGCFGKGDGEALEKNVNAEAEKFVDNRTTQEIAKRLAPRPTNYTVSGQELLPKQIFYWNDTIGQEANTAYSDRNDRGGNNYNTPRKTFDISKFVPAGQPVEIRMTLAYISTPGNSAKLDILANVPGNHTDYNPSNNDEFNWKFSVQRAVVNTIGVAGEKAEVGVQASNGKILGGPLPFSLRLEFHYVKDVLTPFHPWAFEVPSNASGIILESEKAGGPEHLKSQFIVVGPNDELVSFVDFNDISIPTESIFIPAAGPGQYVFYAYYMDGGFLRLRADTPIENRGVVPLPRVVTRTVDESAPSPGLAGRDWLHDGGPTQTPAQGGSEKGFTIDGTFPLDVIPFIGAEDGSADTLMSEIKISSAKGVVSRLQRVLRHDDASGSMGYTADHWNLEHHAQNLAKGAYKVSIVNNSPNAPLGHIVVTYQRVSA